MDLYTTFAPDPLWALVAIGGAGAFVVGRFGRSIVGPTISRWLVIAAVVLFGCLIAYSLVMTWFAPLSLAK